MVDFVSHLFISVRVNGEERLLEPKLLCIQELTLPGFCV